MRKNHVPASCALTALVVWLLMIPKTHGNFHPGHVALGLVASIFVYIYAVVFDLGEGK